MKDVYIARSGAITALGPDLDSLYKGLLDKQTGIAKVARFSTADYLSPYAALIPDLDYRHHDSLIFELADRLVAQISGIDKDTLLMTASTKSAIDLLERQPEKKGLHQAVSPGCLPIYLAEKLGIKTGGININAACASGSIAVAKGAFLIGMGHADAVLICCLDIITTFVFSGFSALQAMSPMPAAPFDRNRQGLTLGEGGAWILLMSKDKARSAGILPAAKICGWGIANDASHVTAPARDARGLKRAILNACRQAGMAPHDISAMNAHGTATVYNDAMEMTAVNALFAHEHLVVNGIKGAIGHTLGAAGGIEVALCTKMLQTRIMPGTVGFAHPDDGTKDCVSADRKTLSGSTILTTNSGFGGINAALILGDADEA